MMMICRAWMVALFLCGGLAAQAQTETPINPTPIAAMDPKAAYEAARGAKMKGDYRRAAQLYEHAFDHVLEKYPEYYGVRLSFLLGAWAELTTRLPDVRDTLIRHRDNAWQAFEQNGESKRFHDFVAISKHLNTTDVSTQRFNELFARDPQTAKRHFIYIWEDLIDAGALEVASQCLDKPEAYYRRALEMLDHMLEMHKRKAAEGVDAQLAGFALTSFTKQTDGILKVLDAAHREAEAQAIRTRRQNDLASRKL